MELSPHGLTPALLTFRHSEFDRSDEVAPYSLLPVLYLQKGTREASPKAVSERTSYYRVRLAFHSLPQVIRGYCTIHRFGPPPTFRWDSPCPWQAHPASGLMDTPCHQRRLRPFRTRFRSASGGSPLRRGISINSPAHSSIGTPSPAQRASSDYL